MMTVKINGEILPEEAIEFEYRRLLRFYSRHTKPEQLKEVTEQLRERAREQAIGTKLLIDEAHRLDLSVPADRVDQKLAAMQDEAGGAEAFEQRVKTQGLELPEVRSSLEEGLKVDLLVEQVCAEVADPTDADMIAYFEGHRDEYEKGEQAQAQHILLPADSDSETDKQVARSKLEELRRKLDDGADFGELAAAHSTCPSGKQTGGSLGWFSRGMMVPEFDEAVFSMEVGALSDIIETQFGLHLVLKTGEEDAKAVAFVDVQSEVRDLLRHAERGSALSGFVGELRQKAEIVIEEEAPA
jgi:parvulin-like peptidyl-prolyl isomerase